jgi:outer membrane receptor protein involved in Fe transport
VFSSFLTFKSEIGKLAYQLGLRCEYTDRKLDYNYNTRDGEKENILAKKHFTHYFPTFHTTYSFSETHQLTASYSKRIKRPQYWGLVPLRQYENPFTYYTGNSKIIPSFTNSYEVGYKKSWNKDFIGMEIFAKSTSNVIEQISRSISTNQFESKPENVGKSFSVGTEVMAGVDIFKWWNLNASTSLYSYKLKVDYDSQKREDNQFRFDSRLNNTILLPASFTLKFDLKYFSPMIYAQSKREAYFFSNFALKKGFKDNKWLVTVSVRDLFSTLEYNYDYKGEGFVIRKELEAEPYFAFKIAYNFDNQK